MVEKNRYMGNNRMGLCRPNPYGEGWYVEIRSNATGQAVYITKVYKQAKTAWSAAEKWQLGWGELAAFR